MAMSVEFKITRPNTETDWPWSGVSGLSSLREQYNVTSSESVSEDGLVWTGVETCPDENVVAYFEEFKTFWDQAGANTVAGSNNITIESRVV